MLKTGAGASASGAITTAFGTFILRRARVTSTSIETDADRLAMLGDIGETHADRAAFFGDF
jgi:hypothetical protein